MRHAEVSDARAGHRSRECSRRRRGLALAGLLAAFTAAAPASAAPDSPAPRARLATRALLLDAVPAGARLVAVGAHGVVIHSDDRGASWTQAEVPVSGMLTCVAFADAMRGWAGGHAGVLLATQDGGNTWVRLDGGTAAGDSFLDLLALPDGRVLAAGAYGLYLVSDDSGASWQRRAVLEEDTHINRLSRGESGTLYLAGEAGTLAVSRDRGDTWEPLESPYDGSFYGLVELHSGRLLAFGLRGHVFVSDDEGAAWRRVAIEHSGLLASGIEFQPGSVALAGAGGQVFVSQDDAGTFAASWPSGLNAVSELMALPNGAAIGVGDPGVIALETLSPKLP